MNKSNWKTNTIGVISLATALATIWAPKEFQPKIIATSAALSGIGFLAAKDHDNKD